MRKILTILFMTVFLMSFTNKIEIESNNEELFSPECFESAAGMADAHRITYPNATDEYNHSVFEYWYDFCEYFTNNDEFQFPPL